MTTFTKFTDEQWAEIQAARADWPANIKWLAVRRKLEQAGRDFWTMRANRRRRLPKDARTILQRALKHVRDLEHDLAELGITHTFIGLKRGLENRLTIYEMSGRSFEGRADAHRELLYLRVIQQWTGPLKGKIEFSRVGPLMRYLTTVLTAMLGNETPTRAGIAKILAKERKRRKKFAEEYEKRAKLKAVHDTKLDVVL